MEVDIIKQLNWRYATKSFDDSKVVPHDTLEILLQSFNLTATSYGLQPIKLMVVQDDELQNEMVNLSYGQKQIAQASHVLIFCICTNIDKEFVTEYFDRVHSQRKTPKEVLKPFEDFLINDFEQKSIDQIESWATKQAYLAMGNLMTVCAMLGIDSCPMEGFEPEAYDSLLKLKDMNLKSVLVMPIGYRSNKDMFSTFKKVRRDLDESVLMQVKTKKP